MAAAERPEMVKCTFCRSTLEPGTGKMFVLKDGTIYHFCSSKCQRNQLHLGRTGRLMKWTKSHAAEKKADAQKHAQAAAQPVPTN